MSAPVELSLAPAPVRAPAAAISRERYEQLARRVRLLSWLSLGAMSVEGFVALLAGIVAGSIALVGFGLDSVVEGFASVIIIWRFTARACCRRRPSSVRRSWSRSSSSSSRRTWRSSRCGR